MIHLTLEFWGSAFLSHQQISESHWAAAGSRCDSFSSFATESFAIVEEALRGEADSWNQNHFSYHKAVYKSIALHSMLILTQL